VVPGEHGQSRLIWSGAEAAVEWSALVESIGVWHERLIRFESVERHDGRVTVTTRPFAALCREDVSGARTWLEAALGRQLERGGVTVRLANGAVRWAPSPAAWGVGGAAAERRLEPAGYGLRFVGRDDEAARVRDLLLALPGREPVLVRLVGRAGSGRRRLMDRIGLLCGWEGARIARRLPADVARDSRPLVVLLGERVRRGRLGQCMATAERMRRGLLIVALGEVTDAIQACPTDEITCRPLSVDQLASAVLAGDDLPTSTVLDLAESAAGSPLTLRLLVAEALRGSPPRSVEEAVVRSLRRVPVAALGFIAAAAVAGEPIGRQIVGAVATAPVRWEDTAGLVGDEGESVHIVSAEVAEVVLRFAPGDPRRIASGLAVALGRTPQSQVLRARLLAQVGQESAARCAALASLEAAEPRAALELLDRLDERDRRLEPGLGVARLELLERCGRVAEAAEQLGGVGPGDPRLGERSVHRGRLFLRVAELRRARAEVESIPRRDRHRSRSLDVAARILEVELDLADGRSDDARSAAQGLFGVEVDVELRARVACCLARLEATDARRWRRASAILERARAGASRTESSSDMLPLFGCEAELLILEGRIADARERWLEGLERAHDAGDRLAVVDAHLGLARVALEWLELAQAERYARRAERALGSVADRWRRSIALVVRAEVAVEIGGDRSIDDLRELLIDAQAAGWRQLGVTVARVLATAELGRGDLTAACQHLETAREQASTINMHREEARICLARARAGRDAGDAGARRSWSEAGLRALASDSRSRLHLELRIEMAGGLLASAGPDRAAAVVRGLARHPGLAAEPGLTAEIEVLQARLVAASGATARAVAGYRQAIERSSRLRRVELRARVIAEALRDLGDDLDGDERRRLLALLAELHARPPRPERLRSLGVAVAVAATAAVPATALEDDGLCRIDELARRAEPDRWGDALTYLARRVPYARAAFVADLGDGLRVVAARRARSEPSRPAAMELALVLCERSRLTADGLRLDRIAEVADLRGHPEVMQWRLGSVMVAAARQRLYVYLDRERMQPPFGPHETTFVTALVERLSLEAPPAVAAPATVDDDDLGLIGESAPIRRLRVELKAVAAFEIPVFLAGESGTGKELAARAIHRRCARAGGPFVPLNCAALTETLLEAELFGAVRGAYSGAVADREGLIHRASGGLLFLDEVAELSPGFQAKLLRVVELGEYRPVGAAALQHADVRVICATNRNLEEAVRVGAFRQDLYYRLAGSARVVMPPLRDRSGDIARLVGHFVTTESRRHAVDRLRFSSAALSELERHPYPGNVRELERLIAGLFARCSGRRVEVDDLPFHRAGAARSSIAGTLAQARQTFERDYLRDLLRRHGGNRTHAARTAGVARQTLVAMLKRLGVDGKKQGPAGERREAAARAEPPPTVG